MTISLKQRHSVWLEWNSQIVASKILQTEIDDEIAATVDPERFEKELEFIRESGEAITDIGEQFENYQEFQDYLQTQILKDA
ncbi:hypothetical protein [Haloarcula sp. Atlit-7R]|uniref:hypothetical protein n=1 Tax=Haloarcula sp. Atlit-7R TaxID=2282125 RepID=UPI000EF16665|nr:hypothetical protein [Haloarcula sp. Atlit-7R]RLM94340.1 hypothetical protein D3D01_15880 [Haloarcula sp. Atlit-7R]